MLDFEQSTHIIERPFEAEARLREVLRANPDSLPATLGLVQNLQARGEYAPAQHLLRRLVEAAPTYRNILAVSAAWQACQDHPLQHAPAIRLALVGSGTLDAFAAHLRVACAQMGLQPHLYLGGFGQWAQEILDPRSAFYAFGPELIVVALDAKDIGAQQPAPTLREEQPEAILSVSDAAQARLEGSDSLCLKTTEALSHLRGLLSALRAQAPAADVLLHTFALPDHSPHAILDVKTRGGQREWYEALNHALLTLVQDEFPQIHLLDRERIEARHGKSRVRDERMWYLAGLPFSESFLPVLTAEHLRFIRPLKGMTRKCLVLDLDNTLWGGVLGEDGPEGIRLGGTAAPGNAFLDFQSALLDLHRRGVLLALCSKNNEEDVWPVIEGHPGMALRREHFAAARINWQDKAANIQEIAHELNLGLDSLVFLDDNPAERALVRERVPQVLTVEMPRDPAHYRRCLLDLDVFETLALTHEDRERGRLYAEQASRKAFEAEAKRGQATPGGTGATDVHAYLADLQMHVRIEAARPGMLARIAQLINKTNQFNLTTRRYTQAQVEAMASEPERWGLFAVQVSDRFGDSGLTGVALIEKQAETGCQVWEIDSLLLSCRVLGRGVEAALGVFLRQAARAGGASRLRGRFYPTPKNGPAAHYYASEGYSLMDGQEGEGSVWEIDLDTAHDEAYPAWMCVEPIFG